MILKKLEIQGFKSFADRTEVVFTPGVIAVVGPNGSGKSNISDAILWVLGEQNVRALRGERCQDVIFAGTDKRRPVGMAEVSLTIDNSSGRLPIEFSEVTVTRRAYRSGESEFFINKTPCRLKDIRELFMDTGVGHEAYSIISQGEIDAILSAKPEDRRALFDEAAGIKKYRHRKKEAERKLESTEQNLVRVNDIIAEIEAEIEPMREQAEIAKRYLDLVSRLREIEVGILVNDLQKLTRELEGVKREIKAHHKAIEDADALLVALEEEKSALAVDLASADAQVERYQSLHQENLTYVERTESQLALNTQKHEAADRTEKLLAEEIAQLEARIHQLEAQRSGMSSEQEGTAVEEAELSNRLTAKTAELKVLEEKINDITAKAEEQKAEYLELAKRLAAQRNELSNLSVRIENLQELLRRRSQELSETERARSKAETERESAQKELDQAKVKLTEISKAISDLRSRIAEKQLEVQKASDSLTQLNRLLVDKQSRLNTLVEMEEAREGYFQGVKSIMTAVKSGQLEGSFAVVADVIKVPKGYETAYEVALGSSLQDIITDTEREAKDAIEFLKQHKAGRATFLPLNMMRFTASPALKEIVGRNGILGLGNELIKFDKKYAPAIDSLLGRTLIAKDIDSALSASRAVIGWSKIVTLDGEIVYPSGAMTGGYSPGKTANLLGRKQEIESLTADVQELSNSISSQESVLSILQDELKDLLARQSRLEEEDTACRMSVLEKERQLEFATREVKRLDSELESLRSERDDIESALRKAFESRTALVTAIENADKQNIDLDGLMAETDRQVRELQDQYDATSAEISAINVELAALTQKKLSMQQTLENSEAAIREISSEIQRKREQLKSAVQEKEETGKLIEELTAELERARIACQQSAAEAEQWRKTKQAIVHASTEVADRIREISRNREDLVQKIHACELKEARLDMQINQTAARLLDEYDITAEEALRREPPQVERGASSEVVRLRREIRMMGDVNTGAVQEYARLSERYEFLNAQRQDLLEAKKKLVDAIKEIDESTRGIFMETFEAVQEAFSRIFQRLFGGGKTELVLSDPDNVLESGIDVIVELPGKKRQNLHLLSGGERALTAAALLFALMSVRPSPFCVLDEVDASLDEANVERFAEMVKEFAQNSQMIVITHNKATMEAADVLYGVTMQEPGVSKIVSVRLSDVVDKN
jgi:chromosome segregation protein